MTDGQVSTRTATDKHFRSPAESGVDTNASGRLLALIEQQISTGATLPWDSSGDCQTLGIHGQDYQMSTRDVGVDAARHTRRTRDIPNTVFNGAPMGSSHDAGVRQLHRDIEAIAHMDDKEVINELVAKGLAGVAERLTYLYDVTEEDEEDIKLDSLRGFATLMIKNRYMHMPQITVTDDGLIQAVWKHPRQGTLVMDFQESGDVEFTLLYGRWDQGTRRRKLSGELHPDHAMYHVRHFVHQITGT